MFTKNQIIQELEFKVLTEKDLVKIGHWAYQMYERKIEKSDDQFYDILLDIAVMEYGPEYFLSYDQLDKIIDELLQVYLDQEYTKLNLKFTHYLGGFFFRLLLEKASNLYR